LNLKYALLIAFFFPRDLPFIHRARQRKMDRNEGKKESGDGVFIKKHFMV
jgi:hypothetical protein